MQATTINNLKKAQGLETEKDTSPRSSNKGDLLKARNLKRCGIKKTFDAIHS